jgi:hypothetical protein
MSAPSLLFVACVLNAFLTNAQGRPVDVQHVSIPPAELARIEASVIRYAHCDQPIICLECAIAPTKVDTTSLTAYFQQALPAAQTRTLTGMILVDINLTAEGVPCCRLLQNYTQQSNERVQALLVDRAVARMPRWKPIRMAGKAVSSSTSLRLLFAGPAGLRAEAFFPGGFHPQLTDTLGLRRSGWRWVKPPAPIRALAAGEYAEFTFSISAQGRVYAVESGRTNMSVSQEQACRQVLEASLLAPLTAKAINSKSYYTFISK